MRRVVITGMGIWSCLGTSLEEVSDSLKNGKSGIGVEEIRKEFSGKIIMVTGAAGSIGSELVRQLAGLNVKKLILFDNAETPMHRIRLELEEKYPAAYDFRFRGVRHHMPKDQTVKCQIFPMVVPAIISKENLEDKNLAFYVCDECGMLLYSSGVHHLKDDAQIRLCYECLLKHNQCQCCQGFFKNDLETLPFNTKVCKACAKTPQIVELKK